MSSVIDLESTWLDPLIDKMSMDEEAVEIDEDAESTVECLVRTSPSIALMLHNVSKGAVPINYKHIMWLLKHRVDSIITGIRFLKPNAAEDGSIYLDEDMRFVLSHPRVRDSLLSIATWKRHIIVRSEREMALFTPMTKVQALSLVLKLKSDDDLSLTDLSTLTALRSLKLLKSQETRLTASTTFLEPLSNLRGLTSLSLYWFRDLNDASLLPLHNTLTGLKELDVTECSITGAFLDHIPTLQTSLTKLLGSGLTPQAFFSCTSLKEITVNSTLATAGPNLFTTFPALTTATHVTVCAEHRKFYERLADYGRPIAATCVDSKQYKLTFTPKALQAFAFLPNLTELIFRSQDLYRSVTNDDLRHLSALTSLVSLKLVNESGRVQTGVHILSHIRAPLRELECDELSSSELTQESPNFAFASSLTRLETWDVDPSFLCRCTRLRALKITSPLSPNFNPALTSLTKLASLELEFDREAPPLSSAHVSALTPVSRRLRNLTLNFHITQDAFQGPCVRDLLAHCKMLESLRLDCTVVSPESDVDLLNEELKEFPQSWKGALRGLTELQYLGVRLAAQNSKGVIFVQPGTYCKSTSAVLKFLGSGPG